MSGNAKVEPEEVDLENGPRSKSCSTSSDDTDTTIDMDMGINFHDVTSKQVAKLFLKQIKVCMSWLFIGGSIFSVFHFPFRLCYSKSELNPVWLAIGLCLDIPRAHQLFVLIRRRLRKCQLSRIRAREVFALLPFNLIVWVCLVTSVIATPEDAWRVRTFQIFEWIKIPPVYAALRHWECEQNSRRKHMFRLGLCLGAILAAYHIFASFWFALGRMRGLAARSITTEGLYACKGNPTALLPECTWGPHQALFDASLTDQYIFSYYWAIIVLTTATPMVQASTTLEVYVTIVMVWSGIIVNACLITVLGTLIINFDNKATKKAEAFDELDSFMDCTHMSPELKKQLKEFRMYEWSRTNGLNPQAFMHEMPPAHVEKIALHMYQAIFEQVPIIAGAPDAFMSKICRMVCARQYPPTANVIHECDIGEEMFFVRDGRLIAQAARKPDQDKESKLKKYREFEAGSFFGEHALVSFAKTGGRRTSDVVTVTYCDLLVLKKEQFDELMCKYPEIAKKIENISNLRQNQGNVFKSAKDRWQNAFLHINTTNGISRIMGAMSANKNRGRRNSEPLMDMNGEDLGQQDEHAAARQLLKRYDEEAAARYNKISRQSSEKGIDIGLKMKSFNNAYASPTRSYSRRMSRGDSMRLSPMEQALANANACTPRLDSTPESPLSNQRRQVSRRISNTTPAEAAAMAKARSEVGGSPGLSQRQRMSRRLSRSGPADAAVLARKYSKAMLAKQSLAKQSLARKTIGSTSSGTDSSTPEATALGVTLVDRRTKLSTLHRNTSKSAPSLVAARKKMVSEPTVMEAVEEGGTSETKHRIQVPPLPIKLVPREVRPLNDTPKPQYEDIDS
jgi:CRP-like cAMP-binding protein